jgi:hypothetical protein
MKEYESKIQRKGLEIRYKGCPKASDDITEEQLEELPVNRQGQLLSIHSTEAKGVQPNNIMDDVWSCPQTVKLPMFPWLFFPFIPQQTVSPF